MPPELREQALALIHARPGPDAVRRVAIELHITPTTLRTWLRHDRTVTGSPIPNGTTDPQPAVPFSHLLAQQAYGLPLEMLCRRWSLIPATQIPSLHRLRTYQRCVLLAVNRRFARRLQPSAVTVSLTNHEPIHTVAEMGYGTIAEIITAVTTARWLTRPCLIYLPSPWSPTAHQIRTLINAILADLDTPPPVTIIDVGDPIVVDLLRDAANQHADHLTALCDTAPDTEHPNIQAAVRYLPQVISELTGRTIRQVILTEPLHQARSAAIAHRLACAHGHYVDILAHTPTPGNDTADAIPRLGDTPHSITTRLLEAPSATRRYWAAIWDIHTSVLTNQQPTDLTTMADYYHHLAQHAEHTEAAGADEGLSVPRQPSDHLIPTAGLHPRRHTRPVADGGHTPGSRTPR